MQLTLDLSEHVIETLRTLAIQRHCTTPEIATALLTQAASVDAPSLDAALPARDAGILLDPAARALLREHHLSPADRAFLNHVIDLWNVYALGSQQSPVSFFAQFLTDQACMMMATQYPGDLDKIAQAATVLTRLVEQLLWAKITLTNGFRRPLPEELS